MYKNVFGPTPNFPIVESQDKIKSNFFVIGGPCSIESEQQVDSIFKQISKDVTYFRGGVFRAGTYPGKNWGWQMELLKMFHEKSHFYGKRNVVDVLDIRDIDKIEQYCDVFQVGMRQAQHYALLEELGKQSKPVILKRGSWMTLKEFMGAAEYVLKGGNNQVILCERGSVSYLDHVRWELSVSMIAKIKTLTGLPVIVDASHGTGSRDIVKPMTLAGVSAGADGCLVECHSNPDQSMSDAEQAISIEEFKDIVSKSLAIRSVLLT